MMTNIRLLAPVQYSYSPPVSAVSVAPESVAGYGAVVEFSKGAAPKSGNYTPGGLSVEDSKLLAAEKARMKSGSELCKTCAERKYQDGSDDMGVSFKAAANISPEAAAGAVMSHEQEHVSHAQSEAREKNMNLQSSVIIHTSICPECKKVYVSGGTTYTRMTPKSEAIDAYAKQAGLAVNS